MKAAVMHGFDNIVFEEIPTPSPAKGELLVRVKSTRVCGTDISMYHGSHPGRFLPRILGHECAGEVVAVGQGVSGFKPGDRIGIDPLVYCGKCYFCRMGKNNLCESGGLMGRETNGSLAEYTIITPERAVRIPDSMPFDVACHMAAVASIYYGQRKSRLIGSGASVVVLGLGSAGMVQTQLARLGGSEVIGVSRSRWKLDLALKLGANIVINANEEDPVEAIMKRTHRGADVVIECAGVPATIRQAYEMVRPGGEIIQYGIGPTSVDNINTFLFYYKDITVYGVRAFTYNDLSSSIKFLEKAIRIEPTITHRFPLEQTTEAFELAEKPGRQLGVVINS